MDDATLEARLVEIQNLLEASLPNETDALPAQVVAHLQEAIEHVLNAQELSDGQKSHDNAVGSSTASATIGATDAVDGGWISADSGSAVTLSEWR